MYGESWCWINCPVWSKLFWGLIWFCETPSIFYEYIALRFGFRFELNILGKPNAELNKFALGSPPTLPPTFADLKLLLFYVMSDLNYKFWFVALLLIKDWSESIYFCGLK